MPFGSFQSRAILLVSIRFLRFAPSIFTCFRQLCDTVWQSSSGSPYITNAESSTLRAVVEEDGLACAVVNKKVQEPPSSAGE